MKNLEKAIEIERVLKAKGTYNVRTIAPFVKDLGFDSVQQYLDERREYFFNKWNPEVYYINISEFADATEEAIKNDQYGIYIPVGKGLHAYHGSDSIDYDLCKELGVKVIELNYLGGTIIGSEKDLSILIIFPKHIGINSEIVINKIKDTISKYVPDVTVSGNDILMDGKKISGSMIRKFDNSLVWAAQVSFANYYKYIKRICNKPAIKKPSYIDSKLLTRDQLEADILDWFKGN